ncbi:hypothetical protein MHYP_G00296130 [Metynnis hypsauchen]
MIKPMQRAKAEPLSLNSSRQIPLRAQCLSAQPELPNRCSFKLTSPVSPSIPIALPVDQPYSHLKKEQHDVE